MTHEVRRIDAHLHLWDLEIGEYSWLGPESGDLYASFRSDDISPALAESGIDGAVLVQAEDSLADTEYLLGVASRTPWVVGVVGWVQLDDPKLTATQLDALSDFTVLSGIRHLVHDDPRADFLDLDGVRESLSLVASQGLAFDIPDAWPRHLARVPALASALDELTVVVDHLGKPPRDWAERAEWRRTLAEVARRPNTVVKFSGLRSATSDYTPEGLTQLWNDALDLFGPSRMMWGSDWPVSGRGYEEIIAPLMGLIATLSDDEQELVLGETAAATYRILEVAR